MDAQVLAKEIVGEVAAAKKSSPGMVPLELAAAKPADFCTIWPKAKPILEFLAGVVIFIPGAGATAGAVLTGLIKVGDQVAARSANNGDAGAAPPPAASRQARFAW